MIWALCVKDLIIDANWDLIPAFKNPMEETYLNNIVL